MGFFDLLNSIDSGDDKKEYKLLEPGIYGAVIEDVTVDEDKQGVVMYVLKFDILNENTKAWLRIRTSDASVKFTAWQLSALEIKGHCKDEASTREALEALVDAAIYNVEITHNDWNGKTYLNLVVKEYMGPADAKTEPSFDKDEEICF